MDIKNNETPLLEPESIAANPPPSLHSTPLTPLLNAFRIRVMNDSMRDAKGKIKELLDAENEAEFVRQLKAAIQKYYNTETKTLTLPPQILDKIREVQENPEMEGFISILDEIGLSTEKTTYTKEEREALAENATHLLQRMNMKINQTFQKTQEINQMVMEIIQLLRSCLKKEDDAKSAPIRGIRSA